MRTCFYIRKRTYVYMYIQTNKQLNTYSHQGPIYIVDMDTQKVRLKLEGHSEEITALDWNGAVLATGAMDASVRVCMYVCMCAYTLMCKFHVCVCLCMYVYTDVSMLRQVSVFVFMCLFDTRIPRLINTHAFTF